MILVENTCSSKNFIGYTGTEILQFSGAAGDFPGCTSNGALRLTITFLKLLEQQFPIGSIGHKMKYRFPVDFADMLSVHVNHLNRSLKDITGKTTSQLIAERITKEASGLLLYTGWNICEIGYCFGFEEGPHFINFFKKNARMSPTAYRKIIRERTTRFKQVLGQF
ncbi:helix-turn-helix domain-containing protein [Mucilaginibacter sp. X4EP1]|uniref:helix-turn-helix domain-containing protein n=1 Tax=Mucilaginibacter sp. X4EP1 TaxID=2723092 RepID=UPI00216731A6|nr:helix-turn-helix domain-containing protein [Mucilaginibacter sp. X4EP1]MCS3813429.1 AraC-like DNA-binding protein [Mucilaginibacter sp. X4EP1]